MIFAGVAQLQERQSSRLQVAGENPAPRSTLTRASQTPLADARGNILQAFAAGLRQDPASWEAGRRDGAAGARWQPRQFDRFSYASGYLEGERFRPRVSKTEASDADELSRLRLHR